MVPSGGLEKLAEIISPTAEDDSAADVVIGGVQRGLKGIQAALESRQAQTFGDLVRPHSGLSRTVCNSFVGSLHSSWRYAAAELESAHPMRCYV